MIAWLLLGFPTWVGAQTYYAEVSLGSSSIEAMRIHKELGSPGGADRLVRRYRQAEGWEYFLLSADCASVAAAEVKSSAWAEVLGRGVAIYQDGGVSGGAAVAVEPRFPPSAAILTARLSRTLGGRDGGLRQLARAEDLRFVYERGVEEGGVYYAMKHVFSRQGQRRDMTIEPMGEVGVSSRLSMDGETAEAWTQGVAVETVDAVGVSRLLTGMGPGGIFAFILELPTLLHSAPHYQSLELSESSECGGRACGVLLSASQEGGVQLVVDPVDWWLMEASILGDMGLVTYRFGDWREIDTNLVLPFQLELVRDGRVLEKVKVLELSLDTPQRRPEGPTTSLLKQLP